MKKNITLLILLASAALGAIGQRPVMELTFTAVNNVSHVQLDSIKVMNRTQGGDTVLYWPDTVLSFYYVGIPEVSNIDKNFRVFQNYPNPVTDHTTVSMYVPQEENVSIVITDLLGRIIITSEKALDQGTHSFRFTPGGGSLYFFTAKWRGNCSSIKILQAGSFTGERTAIEYAGCESSLPQLKAVQITQDFFFSPGDELLYIGYTNGLESGIPDSPEESKSYTFQFATNIPCPGMPRVGYEAKLYNTIQIFSQCWLKENLDVGTMISGATEQSNNGATEKYCFGGNIYLCGIYGGLYQWNEMMKYSEQPGAQGICPPGWHVPTDEDWKVLEGAVDSQYGIGEPEWDLPDEFRGYDAGTNLKTVSGWNYNGNGSDLYGFSGLPGGYRAISGYFESQGSRGFWWSSDENSIYNSWQHSLYRDYLEVRRYESQMAEGLSVRCLRDAENSLNNLELTFTAVNNTSHVRLDSIRVMNRAVYGGETKLYWPDTVLVIPFELLYSPGDTLLLIGYAGTLESGILHVPETNHIYTFQFATNIPCPGTPTVEYKGKVYNTVQIFSQCWLKENLDVGTFKEPGWFAQTDNGIIEKYCYDNDTNNCNIYGGLYQIGEMMQYVEQQGAQGICPPGWHVPTDEEWKVLEASVDSQFEIGNPIWDDWGERGFDAGTNLKTTSGWYSGGNGTDLFGFSALPGGIHYSDMWYDDFSGILTYGTWWTSSYYYEYGNQIYRSLYYSYPGVGRHTPVTASFSQSVRCIRHEAYTDTLKLTFTAVDYLNHIQLDSIKVMNRTLYGEIMIYWPDTTVQIPGDLCYSPNDELLFIGYADALESGMIDIPEESQTCTFEFATNMPCPGTPTVEYEGQVYNTIQILGQCWLKENLNIGVMINGTMEQSNNGTIEKYCYLNNPDNCNIYGGLYQWNEMMQYGLQPGTQGVCPPGWHLPTDEEWKVLEGAVDSLYGIGDNEWSSWEYLNHGYDAGKNLKTTSGWNQNGNGTDLFGFSALPGGYGYNDGIGIYGTWWTSSQYEAQYDEGYRIYHALRHNQNDIERAMNHWSLSFSVRCLRDD